MFNYISTALMTLLGSLTKIQSFYNYEATNLDGTPALTLTPSANDSEYSTTSENKRAYGFVIRLYVARGSTADAERTSENTMRDLVDSVIDRLDKNYYLSGVTLQTQTGYIFINMTSAPSQWGYSGRENEMRVAEIRVKLYFNIDTTLIT